MQLTTIRVSADDIMDVIDFLLFQDGENEETIEEYKRREVPEETWKIDC